MENHHSYSYSNDLLHYFALNCKNQQKSNFFINLLIIKESKSRGVKKKINNVDEECRCVCVCARM